MTARVRVYDSARREWRDLGSLPCAADELREARKVYRERTARLMPAGDSPQSRARDALREVAPTFPRNGYHVIAGGYAVTMSRVEVDGTEWPRDPVLYATGKTHPLARRR